MRYLLIFAVIALLAWRWRASRPERKSASAPKQNGQPMAMIPCHQCGVHLPVQDAVEGKLGSYCCQDHRRQAEP